MRKIKESQKKRIWQKVIIFIAKLLVYGILDYILICIWKIIYDFIKNCLYELLCCFFKIHIPIYLITCIIISFLIVVSVAIINFLSKKIEFNFNIITRANENENRFLAAFSFIVGIFCLLPAIICLPISTGDSFSLLALAFSFTTFAMTLKKEEDTKEKVSHNNTTIPQKLIKDNLKLSNKLSNLEKENKDLREEINVIKQQNEEIIKLLKENNQKNDCVISRIAKKIKK